MVGGCGSSVMSPGSWLGRGHQERLTSGAQWSGLRRTAALPPFPLKSLENLATRMKENLPEQVP